MEDVSQDLFLEGYEDAINSNFKYLGEESQSSHRLWGFALGLAVMSGDLTRHLTEAREHDEDQKKSMLEQALARVLDGFNERIPFKSNNA